MQYDPIVLQVPFNPQLVQYRKSICFESLDDAQKDSDALLSVVSERLVPKVLLCQFYIDAHFEIEGLPAVSINGVHFSGKALSALDGVHRVIGYVATCGTEVEGYHLNHFDMLAPYWLDCLKTQALLQAQQYLFSYCRTQFGIKKPLSLNPGSGNVDIWPIEQLQGLQRILGGFEKIGVTLTESFLMIPNKTICGLLFASSSDYESCAYCERENCPDRRVAFSKRL
ncbi:MAG: hypothetical protein EOM15_02100 [Spirochaetia bacterium]|nr:hypothetical protein [Spirochaetia bacterium]